MKKIEKLLSQFGNQTQKAASTESTTHTSYKKHNLCCRQGILSVLSNEYFLDNWEIIMDKKDIQLELKKLLEFEESILYKLAIDTDTDDEQLQFITKKIFELSELILRLERALKEIKKNET